MSQTLQVMGQICPFPLVKAKETIANMQSGELLTIHFDCTQATESIPRWAAEEGHEVTNFEQMDLATWSITIKKG